MIFNIQPLNLLRALSIALELSAGGLSRHHWRTGMIAKRIAEELGLDDWQRQVLVYSALLHDLGAAARWDEREKLYEQKLGSEVYAHAERGYRLLKDSPQLGMLAEPIRHHHDKWDGTSPSGLAGVKIPLLSRIINLADRIDVQVKDKTWIFEQRPLILAEIEKLSGIDFDPELVRVVKDFSSQDSFWLDLTNQHYYDDFFNRIDEYSRMRFSIDDTLNIADIFSRIIDSTSRFTGRHSRSVAAIASFLAKAKGYSAEEVKTMQIAGLLHDLGKLSIPNDILEKPGQLTEFEFATIKQHPYYTYRILEKINGFSLIAEWAAYHHETLDGCGYPFGIREEHLRLGSRIVGVADIFVALTEHRPYRDSLSLSKVEEIMFGMAKNGKIDKAIVAELFASRNEAYALVDLASGLSK
ncbi:MAG: HD domain-containing protein [Pelosinus sp.]|nr:HD domain-containing protein [Pelosinus sp.]